jgi:hypothetical protein
MVKQSVGFLFAVLILGLAPLSAASAAAAESAKVSVWLNGDGSGGMVANSQTNPETETWFWEACNPDLTTCSPFGTGRHITTAGAPAETVLKATSNYGAAAVSPLWHGDVASATPPSVNGVVRANELVTPVPGVFAGGWQGDLSWMQLSVCHTATGVNCTTITDPGYSEERPETCSHSATVIDPVFTGEYLRVADRQSGPNPITAGVGTSSPYGQQVWTADATTSVAVVGRISRATGPRAAHCGPPPLVRVSISKSGVASVRCALGCDAVLIAQRGRRRARLMQKIAPFPLYRPRNLPIPRLRLSPRALAALGLGRIRMTVKVGGRIVAHRIVLRS